MYYVANGENGYVFLRQTPDYKMYFWAGRNWNPTNRTDYKYDYTFHTFEEFKEFVFIQFKLVIEEPE